MNLRFKFIPTQKPFYNRTDKHRFASLCFTCADLLSIVHVTYYGDTPPPIRRLTQLTRRSLLSPFLFFNLCGIQSLFPRQHGKARNQPGIKEREREEISEKLAAAKVTFGLWGSPIHSKAETGNSSTGEERDGQWHPPTPKVGKQRHSIPLTPFFR
jgi:hypothetical protein